MSDAANRSVQRNDALSEQGATSSRLTERDRQLAELHALLDDSSRGVGRIALISGASASGKTWLLHHFLRDVGEHDPLVMETSGVRAERELAFGVLRRMTESVRHLVDLHQHFDGLSRSGDDEAGRLRAMAEMAGAFVGLAGGRTLVVAVDDVHHADPESLEFLLVLARRMRRARMLLVLTEPVRLPRQHTGFHAELLRQPGCGWIRLRMLSEAGTRTFLGSRFPVAAAARLAAGCHETTGGNPLLLRALVEDRPADRNEHVEMFRLRPAEAFAQAVLDCLHRCEPEVRAVARGAAVLGDGRSTVLLARLLDGRAMALERWLDDLEECGILRDRAFREPLARTAILHGAPPATLAELHARAARLLHGDGAPATEVARHLLDADVAPEAWTVEVLRQAAEYAATRDELAFAQRCLTLAHDRGRDEVTRAAVRVRIVGLTWRSNPAAAETNLPGLVGDLAAGRLAASEVMPAVSSLSWFGRAPAAADAVARLMSAPDVQPAVAAVLDVARRWLTVHHPSLRARFPEPTPARSSIDSPTPAMDPVTSAFRDATRALAAAAVGERSTAETAEEATKVLQRFQLADGTLQPLVFGLLALICAGGLDTAQVWTDQLLRECAERHAPSWQAVLTSVRGEIALRRGDLPRAARDVGTAFSLLPADGWGTLIALPLSTLVQAESAMGRCEQAGELLRRPVPDGLEGTLLGAHLLRARGRAALAGGQFHAALRDFTACGEQLRAWGGDQGWWLRWRVDSAEACLALGQPRLARALAEEELRHDPEAAHGDGRLMLVLARCVEPSRRLPMLNRAVSVLERGEDRLQLAAALGELGRRHRALGDSNLSRMLVRKAWHQAKSCGAEPMCQQLIPGSAREGEAVVGQVDREDGQASRRPVAALSQAEARVATLAAGGHLNREIAAQLFVTVSTVEQHLTRIYRKLNIKRRSDLPARLSEIDLLGGTA